MIRRSKQVFWIFIFTVIASWQSNAQTVAVANLRQNTIYVGINNHLKIVVEGASCNSISVSTDNGKISKTGTCEFNYIPSRPGMAQVVVRSSKGTYNYLMRAESTPNPLAFVGSMNGGITSKKQLILIGGLQVKYPGLDIKTNLKVKHYSFQIFREQQALSGNSVNGQGFSKDMKARFDQMVRNDKVLFYSIVAEDAKGDTYIIPPVEFIIQ